MPEIVWTKRVSVACQLNAIARSVGIVYSHRGCWPWRVVTVEKLEINSVVVYDRDDCLMINAQINTQNDSQCNPADGLYHDKLLRWTWHWLSMQPSWWLVSWQASTLNVTLIVAMSNIQSIWTSHNSTKHDTIRSIYNREGNADGLTMQHT